MKTIYQQPYAETFEGSMHGEEISVLYSFMLKRISCDLTTSELSFLMGYPTDLIKKREELDFKGFDLLELEKLSNATSGLTRGFILSDLGLTPSICRMVRTVHEKTIEHAFFQVLDDKIAIERFRFLEENRDYKAKAFSRSDEMAIRETEGLLNLLYEGSFFLTERTPLSIYHRCASISGLNTLDPVYVQNALEKLTGKRGYPRLKRSNSKDYGCLYRKEFGKMDDLTHG